MMLAIGLLAAETRGCSGDAPSPFGGADGDTDGDGDGDGDADADADTDTDTDTDACLAAAAFFDFEDGDGGFTHAPSPGFAADPWERGQIPWWHCRSGDNCWGTDLAGDYQNCLSAHLLSPVFDLSPCAGEPRNVELRFWHAYWLEEMYAGGWYDGAAVQFSGDGGATWDDVAPVPGYQGVVEGNYSPQCNPPPVPEIEGLEAWSGAIPGGDWTEVTVSVGEAHRTAGFRFRFLFGSDRGVTDRGWFIDDVALVID